MPGSLQTMLQVSGRVSKVLGAAPAGGAGPKIQICWAVLKRSLVLGLEEQSCLQSGRWAGSLGQDGAHPENSQPAGL